MHEIVAQFRIAGSPHDICRFGSGHINASYRVKSGAGEYLLQRINHHVFPDVPALSNNIKLVTDHIRQRAARAEGQAGRQRTPELIPTLDGQLWHLDATGNYWRMFEFLTGLVSYDLVETPEQAYEGAKSYGYFLRFLTDFPAGLLVPVIPDFHNVPTRLRALDLAGSQVEGKPGNRLSQCRPELRRIANLADDLTVFQKLWDKGQLPTRVTHNDTKFNNVLQTPEGEGRAVIDLDTVMPGIVHFDYGDGIRTGVTTAPEDEADLELVGVDEEKYRAFDEGYLSVTADCLTPTERHYLPRSGALLAYLMAVRFLTDYLSGDRYYSTDFPGHNLVRARNQLKMAELLNRL